MTPDRTDLTPLIQAHGHQVLMASELLAWLQRSGACLCCGQARSDRPGLRQHDPQLPCGRLVQALVEFSDRLRQDVT